METNANIPNKKRFPYVAPLTTVDSCDIYNHLLQTSVPVSDDDKQGEWDGDVKDTPSGFGNLW